ncbi:MAG: hypothetical protein UH788_11855 [Treponemataceae bacterium]|nr:hypothetical protein [Treponemataceae bacterium]
MKKIICLFIFVLISFSYLNSLENSNLQNIEDMQNQILQSLNDSNSQANKNTENSNILKILEENNKIIAEEQQKNIQEQEREKRAAQEKKRTEFKEKNKTRFSSGYFGGGGNLSSSLVSGISDKIYEVTSPVGLSFTTLFNIEWQAYKLNLDFDSVCYSSTQSKNSSCFLFSLGLAPIHTNYAFLGLYITFGTEKINNYSYTSFGISGNFIIHLGQSLGLYLNIDATERGEGKWNTGDHITLKSLDYADTWRVSPSIGVVIQLWKK